VLAGARAPAVAAADRAADGKGAKDAREAREEAAEDARERREEAAERAEKARDRAADRARDERRETRRLNEQAARRVQG
jgi:hypothetical protein